MRSHLKGWINERGVTADEPFFISNRGGKLSRDAIERIVRKHVEVASKQCSSLVGKRISPHVLRHTAAMELLQNGVDRTVIALWLGHESVETTQIYVHADIEMKERAMAKMKVTRAKPGRFLPEDAFFVLSRSALIMPTCSVGRAHKKTRRPADAS